VAGSSHVAPGGSISSAPNNPWCRLPTRSPKSTSGSDALPTSVGTHQVIEVLSPGPTVWS
jgi:hypothetical protein